MDIRASEITPEAIFHGRRRLLGAASALTALGSGLSLAGPAYAKDPRQQARLAEPTQPLRYTPWPGMPTERLTPIHDVTGYNNFYEFGTDKADPQRNAPGRLLVRPYQLSIEGLVAKPQVLGIDDLIAQPGLEERIYRLRCVEGWSMVIPWVGFSLSRLIAKAQPLGSAKYVEFVSLADKTTMPGLSSRVLDWPYREGLRLDEAMHPLTTLAVGLYGKTLPAQNGAPIRLVVPWKYGFKSAKSIVRIRLIEQQPTPSWVQAAPQEYGFYSNVNPSVPHRRWSQATERRIGEDGLLSPRRPTLPFNGYAEQVAHLYTGMDLRQYY
ncbi:MAG: sulfoxide reductase catalytic subunit YedY [Pseudomonadota bacterium]